MHTFQSSTYEYNNPPTIKQHTLKRINMTLEHDRANMLKFTLVMIPMLTLFIYFYSYDVPWHLIFVEVAKICLKILELDVGTMEHCLILSYLISSHHVLVVLIKQHTL
jgi:hypothetical protein